MDRLDNDIKRLLLEYSCRPALSGFNVLASIIRIACLNREYTCNDLFNEYLKDRFGEVSEKKRRSVYRAAQYCLDNSLSSEKGVYQFVMLSVVKLEV